MRRAVSLLALLTTLGAAMSSSGPVSAAPASPRSTEFRPGVARSTDYVPGEVLVKYKRSVEARGRVAVRSAAGLEVKSRIPAFATEVLRTPAGRSVPATVARLSRDPRVKLAEPNYILRPTGTLPIPNDPEFSDLWGFNNTGQNHETTDGGPARGTADADGDVLEAWSTTQGSEETVIAVVDSGVDVNHPDLAANIWQNPDETPGGGDDGDPNTYPNDVNGWDFAQEDNTLLETKTENQVLGTAHGTHVAGTIAAQGDNATGVIGVCPNCKIMVLKFMKPVNTDMIPGPDEMLGNVRDELEALAYAKQMGADIVNGSYGGTGYSGLQRSALAGLKRKGVLGVFAAGNYALDNDIGLLDSDGVPLSPAYPASYELPEIVSVGAGNHRDQYGYETECAKQFTRNFCSVTNFGEESVDLVAPGIDIASTVPTQENENGDIDVYNGTSMASPFVAGVAGLIESAQPSLTPMEIKSKLMRGVDKPSTLDNVFSTLLSSSSNAGWPGVWSRTDGRINAVKALGAPTTPIPATDGSIREARLLESSQKGALVWGGDTNDVYKKRLDKGKTYEVTLNGPPLVSGEEDFSMDLLVYRPGTKDLWQFGKLFRASGRSGGTNSNDEVVRFTAPRNGRFYFQVSSFLSLKYPYTLKFDRIVK